MLEEIRGRINRSKKLVSWLLFSVILIGGFLRIYQYHDWLFFKWDQARDATLVSEAIEKGPGYLPLLGPRATKVGEDYLRLGPAFYYIQYLSGALLNSTKPDIFAYPDTFFAILIIPLLYLFSRLYFSRFNSLLITALYAFSFLVIQYSRFAWNPNAVPFWMLLTFYAFLKMLKADEYKKKIIYLSLFSFAFLIATQYHFFAMFGLIAIMAVYVFFHLEIWKTGKFFTSAKNVLIKTGVKKILIYVFTFVIIFGIIYSPVIISDTKTGWSNSKNFIGAFSEKPRDDKTFGEKLLRNFREQAKSYTLLTTSFWSREGKKADPYPVIFGLFLMASGVFLPLWERRKIKDPGKRNFLLLLPIWTIMFFLITISTSYQLRPRYFTPIFPLAFIIIGLWISFLQKIFSKKGILIGLAVFASFFLMNVYGTAAWFKDNKIAQEREFPTDRNFILKKDDGITLGQLEKVAGYIYENKKGRIIPYYSKAEYKQPLEYLLLREAGNNSIDPDHLDKSKDLIPYEYIFAVNTVKGGMNSVSDKIKDYAEEISSKQFGQLIVFKMKVNKNKVEKIKNQIDKEEVEESVAEDENSIEGEEDDGKTERLIWKDIL